MTDWPAAHRRPLGTMVAYGFPRGDVGVDLALAGRLGASLLEVLPDWAQNPDPRPLRQRAGDAGLWIHSVHGCWGGQSIRAPRVDLASLDPATWAASLDDLKECLDWTGRVGGRIVVVHPGGLSDPEDGPRRTDALARGLIALADHVAGSDMRVAVENMPPGVHPGSRMRDLAALLAQIDRPELGLAVDTGHGNLTSTAHAETLAAGSWLISTHVHDNNGRQDSHHPPGRGTIAWPAWVAALDAIGYEGPVMLECIRLLRQDPAQIDALLQAMLDRLTVRGSAPRET